jgi:hypothetical protein
MLLLKPVARCDLTCIIVPSPSWHMWEPLGFEIAGEGPNHAIQASSTSKLSNDHSVTEGVAQALGGALLTAVQPDWAFKSAAWSALLANVRDWRRPGPPAAPLQLQPWPRLPAATAASHLVLCLTVD